MGGWSSPPIVSCCDTFSVLHPLVDAEPIPGGLAGLWGPLSHVLMLRGWWEGILKLFAQKSLDYDLLACSPTPVSAFEEVQVRQVSSLAGLAEEHLGSVYKGVGKLAVLHQLTDMAIEGSANRCELGEMNVPSAGLDPVIGQPRHPEDGGRCFLGKPEHAATPP